MRTAIVLVMLVQASLVVGLGVALRSEAMPLGVRGEWEWQRLPRDRRSAAPDLAIGLLTLAGFAGVAAVGMKSLSAHPSRRREAFALAALLAAAVTLQAIVPGAAPEGYGLSKWALALYQPGSSGYYTVAKQQVRDPWRFLADYPEWIRHQDSLHVGTHPPGLFLVARGLLRAMESRPAIARRIVSILPGSVEAGFQAIAQFDTLPRADRAALALTGFLTLLACASTVVPLYLLARLQLPPPTAWAAASLWPLVPSAILFQPAADAAFPLLSTSALALAAAGSVRAGARLGVLLALLAGVVLAVGMAFTLAFLPVGLIAGVVLATAPASPPRRRALLIAATGAGFLGPTLAAWALTGANPFVVWWWNQRNHARFYVEYPRSYLAWVLVNPVELAVALGLPAAAWGAVGLFVAPREVPRTTWATLAVLVVLTLVGKNLSEVARLWLPMMPPLLASSALGLTRLGGGPLTLAATLGLLGIETLVLEATIQVVYPI